MFTAALFLSTCRQHKLFISLVGINLVWVSFQTLVWEWDCSSYAQDSQLNCIHLLLITYHFTSIWLHHNHAIHTNQKLMMSLSDFLLGFWQLTVSLIWFTHKGILSLLASGMTLEESLYGFLSSFHAQSHLPLLLSKLSGSWKTSSPVVSVLTPTLNLNCCGVSMCFASSV